MDHIRTLRLFDLSQQDGFKLNEKEREHFRTCEECQHVVEIFARQFNPDKKGLREKPEDAA